MKAQTWRHATVPGGEREDGSSGRREDGASGEQQNGRIKVTVASRRTAASGGKSDTNVDDNATSGVKLKISISGNGRAC